jgi:exosortase/archaeosortase family protein
MTGLWGDDRAHWLALGGIVCAINGYAAGLAAAFSGKDTVVGQLGLHPIVWFTIGAVAAIAFAADDPRAVPSGRMTRTDVMVLAIALALAFAPQPVISAVGVVLTGARLVAVGAPHSRARRSGIVLLALTSTLIWGRMLIYLFGPVIMGLDAHLVGGLSGTAVAGTTVAFSGGQDTIVIAAGCSSLHNLTVAILLWAAFTQLLDLPLSARSLLLCLAAALASVSVNVARLVTLVHHRAAFEYWHTGAGGSLFAWAGVVVVAIVVGLGCHALARRV